MDDASKVTNEIVNPEALLLQSSDVHKVHSPSADDINEQVASRFPWYWTHPLLTLSGNK